MKTQHPPTNREPEEASEPVRRFPRFTSIGILATDTEDERIRKATLTLTTVLVCALSPLWVATYFVLGFPLSASIPLAYLCVSGISLVLFARTRRYRAFRFTQLTLLLVLPFLLQWSLGGVVPASLVSLWALTAPLGALMFAGVRQAVPWFVAYLALVAGSTALEPVLDPVDMPPGVQLAFFAGNVVGVSLTAYLLLRYFVRERAREHERSERLLLNVLPESIAARLKGRHEVIADRFPEATVLFADIVGFTPMSAGMAPEDVVGLLDEVFTAFDRLAEALGLEKIKTIGDAYMVAGGIPIPRSDHCEAVVEMALAMLREIEGRGESLRLRIGIDTGPVVAGVIGRRKFIYDLWGTTVNTASRMESHGISGRVQVTERVVEALRDRYRFDPRGIIEVKGIGPMQTWLVAERR